MLLGNWESFRKNPLPGVHLDYLVQCLAPLVIRDEAVVRQTFATDAVLPACLELLCEHLQLKPLSELTPSPEQAGLAALDTTGWHQLANVCGLMFWSQALLRELRAPVLRVLESQFGPSWWRWVMEGREITTAMAQALPQLEPPEIGQAWVSEISAAGVAVLDAWTATLDDDLAAWVRLKQSRDTRVSKNRQVNESMVSAFVDVLHRAQGVSA